MIDEKQFKELCEHKGTPLVSIYVPTYRSSHNQEDQLRFKNALKKTHQQLQSHGMKDKEADAYLRPARKLLDQPKFWSYLSDGLAVFIGTDFFHHEILPITFDEFVYVGERFHLSPMLPMLNGKNRFFLLALSQNQIRFFEGDRYSITPIDIDDLVPQSMEDIFDLSDVREHLQHHSVGAEGGQNAVYHGQGQGEDDRRDDIRKYFKDVNDGLMKILQDEKLPMVIACVDYLLPLYKEVNDYPYLMDKNVSGNPDQDDPVLLHEKAWEVVKDKFNVTFEADKERFGAEMAAEEASASIPDIISAAYYQKVETLFLRKGEHQFGQFDPDKNATTLHETYEVNDRDLLDLAAVHTHLNGGRVYLLEREEMPVPTANANAIYRFK